MMIKKGNIYMMRQEGKDKGFPVLALSNEETALKTGTVVVVPLSRHESEPSPSHVQVVQRGQWVSFVICERIRSVPPSWLRHKLGFLDPLNMRAVDKTLAALMDL